MFSKFLNVFLVLEQDFAWHACFLFENCKGMGYLLVTVSQGILNTRAQNVSLCDCGVLRFKLSLLDEQTWTVEAIYH